MASTTTVAFEGSVKVDVSSLTTVTPSNANRDEAGNPKDQSFGGVRRARHSSQAHKSVRKRYIEDRLSDKGLKSYRTKMVVYKIAEAIRDLDDTISTEDALAMALGVAVLVGIVKTDKGTPKVGDGTLAGAYKLKALGFVAEVAIREAAALAVDLCKDPDIDSSFEMVSYGEKKKKTDYEIPFMRVVDKPSDLPGDYKDRVNGIKDMRGAVQALTGSFNADAPDLCVDATVQVAHSMGVGRMELGSDYYTAMDECSVEEHAGCAMMGSHGFTSMVAYDFSNVDMTHLVESLGDRDVALEVLRLYLESCVFAQPQGKINSFANQNRPSMVYVRVHTGQPLNLAGAFERPVEPEDDRSMTEVACERLVDYVVCMDEAYDTTPDFAAVTCASPDAKGASALCDGVSVPFAKLVDGVVDAVASML